MTKFEKYLMDKGLESNEVKCVLASLKAVEDTEQRTYKEIVGNDDFMYCAQYRLKGRKGKAAREALKEYYEFKHGKKFNPQNLPTWYDHGNTYASVYGLTRVTKKDKRDLIGIFYGKAYALLFAMSMSDKNPEDEYYLSHMVGEDHVNEKFIPGEYRYDDLIIRGKV